MSIREKSRWQNAIYAGVQMASSSAAIMVKNCGLRSRWTAATDKPSTWRRAQEATTVRRCRTVDDRLPDTSVQWLTDNGSSYTAHETRRSRES